MRRATLLIGLALLPAFARAASGEGAHDITAGEYRQGLKTLRGHLEKRGEDADAAARFVDAMSNALPGSSLQPVPVTRDVFAAFLRYQAAWARKTRNSKNPRVTKEQLRIESARADELKEVFRQAAALHSPRFYGAFQAAVKEVRITPLQEGRDYAGNSAAFFGDQIDDSYTRVDAGDVALENGDAWGAIAEADAALRINAENADAYVLRAGAHFYRRDYAAAVKDARLALRLEPGNLQARAIVSLSGIDRARTSFSKAVHDGASLADDRRASLPKLGPVLDLAPAALPLARPSLSRPQAGLAAASSGGRPGAPTSTPAVGALLSRELTVDAVRTAREDARSSIDQLDTALILNPRNAEARGWRSTILNRIGEYTAALAASERSLAAEPDDAVAHFNKAYAKAGAGDKDGAIGALEAAARIDASYQPLVEQARAMSAQDDMTAIFKGSAAKHEPAVPSSRRRRFPPLLVVLGGIGALLAFAGAALLLRK